MHHNYQIEELGSCGCVCHRGIPRCNCGANNFFNEMRKSRKPGKTKLVSRVKAFAAWQPNDKIAVKSHKIHANFG